MPLRTEFKASINIELGYEVKPLVQQCAEQGLVLKDPDLWEERRKAWSLLRIGGFLTDTEVARIAHRLIQEIQLSVGFETALSEVRVQMLQPEEEPEAGLEPAPATDPHTAPPAGQDALGHYLKECVE